MRINFYTSVSQASEGREEGRPFPVLHPPDMKSYFCLGEQIKRRIVKGELNCILGSSGAPESFGWGHGVQSRGWKQS